MRNFFATIICCVLVLQVMGQKANVQPTNSIEATLVGLGLTHEFAVADKVTIYCRAGVDGFCGYDNFDGFQYGFTPALKFGPRFYYDLSKRSFKCAPIPQKIKPLFDYSLERRQSKPRRVLFNTANYFTIMCNYYSGVELGLLDVGKYFSVVPQWGMRRSIGQQFYIDFAAGVGYGYDYWDCKWKPTLGLEFRIGYGF